MKITELHMTTRRSSNLGNSNYLTLEAGAKAVLDEGDDVADVRSELVSEINKSLHAQLDMIREGE
ncbi:conserved protein of unknown function [Rhodovastum atsumiense]|uniref:Uncharacterized protein n=1 Tax=Rhodovastum atsumiense TaxID=504468 RepID=A0A5M6IJT4_9PROT|nr:hypothetical protein [Rhodovastum atsumiense]KAA5607945.1 hypothetical protein F1189_31485 [Rhodovastum atsumiense]CAH2603819.1 conserved protein of unknown function [Rhodovastum atsumiense]